jgi:hypothetical protein
MTGSVGSRRDTVSVNAMTMIVRPHNIVVKAMRASNDYN